MSGGLSAPGFWWRTRPSLLARLLAPVSWIYGTISARRMQRPPQARPALPVVCVGNFVAGGSGKTPMALALRTLLLDAGWHPVFLTRGYGGTLGNRAGGPVAVDLARHTAAEVGDEALLLAEAGPTVVSADRVAGARHAETLGDILIMDDGFQNPALEKTLSLVLVDAETGNGNGLCHPAGPLRAPLRAQLPRADALVVVGTGTGAHGIVARAHSLGIPVFEAAIRPDSASGLSGRRVLAFAGIGRPEKVFASLRAAGAEVIATRAFGDHHVLSDGEAGSLLAEAEAGDLLPVTTTKDRARLTGVPAASARARLRDRIAVLAVEMHMGQPARFRDFILGRVGQPRP